MESDLPKSLAVAPFAIHDSPNHDGQRPQTLGIILHSTRSGKFTPIVEYGKTIAYMMQPGTVSSHRVIGVLNGQHAQMVPDNLIAWHAQEDNERWLSIELTQAKPEHAYSLWQIGTAVDVCAKWCQQYGLVPSAKTIRRHSDTEQGKRNGKSDPGDKLNYDAFIKHVKARLALWG